MNFKIKGQGKEVEFWLEENAEEGVTLKAKKEGKDSSWNICIISQKGLERCTNIGEDLGFPKDEENRIKLNE